jgi:hypothetical protein
MQWTDIGRQQTVAMADKQPPAGSSSRLLLFLPASGPASITSPIPTQRPSQVQSSPVQPGLFTYFRQLTAAGRRLLPAAGRPSVCPPAKPGYTTSNGRRPACFPCPSYFPLPNIPLPFPGAWQSCKSPAAGCSAASLFDFGAGPSEFE